jgi:hypothetical protein
MGRFSKHQTSNSKIRGWFKHALDWDDPMPSAVKLDKLARLLQVLLNRTDNVEFKRAGATPLFKLKDVSPGEHLNELADKVQQLAKQMLVPIDQLEAFAGKYIWQHPTRDIPFEEVRELMKELAFFASPQKSGSVRGQPSVPWRDAARKLSEAVRAAMQDVGYRGRLGLTDPEGVPVIVTAAAISWAYGKPISPAGFVTAMRDRDRAKKNKSSASVLNRRNKDSLKS